MSHLTLLLPVLVSYGVNMHSLVYLSMGVPLMPFPCVTFFCTFNFAFPSVLFVFCFSYIFGLCLVFGFWILPLPFLDQMVIQNDDV